jgi:ubiquinone/menaquinone biosynthesis C-methylase UbiE
VTDDSTNTTNVQRDQFLKSEGDAWFRRNSAHLAEKESLSTFLLSKITLSPATAGRTVLEIGCGDGRNLDSFGVGSSSLYGIDPSREAVIAGTQRNPSLRLAVGSSDDLPYGDNHFDVVIFGFCLYLIDRSLLFKSVAEVDRVLKDGGQLIIIDFDPKSPSKRPYLHVNGLISYKADYSKIFLGDPAYSLIQKIASDHSFSLIPTEPSERVSVWSLRKDLANAYQQE